MLPSARGIVASAKTAPAGGSAPTAAFHGATGVTTNATSYNFAGRAIGTAGATRRVVVAVAGRDTAAFPTGVTVGGVALTRDEGRNSTHTVSIWSGVIPTGTSADVAITYAATQSFCGIGVWSLDRGAFVIGGNGVNASGTIGVTVATSPNQVVIGAAAYAVLASLPAGSATWVAATERYDGEVDGRFRNHSGADMVSTGGSTNMTVTISNPDSAGAGAGAACAAAYG